MKNLLFIFSLLISVSLSSFSQEKPSKQERMDRIKAQKVAFYTEKMDLSVDASQKFWPLYNEYFNKKDSLYHLSRNLRNKLKDDTSTLTTAQKESALNTIIKLKIESGQLEHEYLQKFKNILTIDQIILLNQAEYEFRMRLFKQLRGTDRFQKNQQK